MDNTASDKKKTRLVNILDEIEENDSDTSP